MRMNGAMNPRSSSNAASASDSSPKSQTTTICRVQNDGRIQPGRDVLDDLGIEGGDRVALTLRDDPGALSTFDIDEVIDVLDDLDAVEVDREQCDRVLNALENSGMINRENTRI